MDANENYAGPAGIQAVTTEAMMVASNEPTPKGIIRIVTVKGEEIDYNAIDGEFHASNPYFSVEYEWPRFGKITTWFTAYAFTKRFSNERPGLLMMYHGDGELIGSYEVRSWWLDQPVLFTYDFKGGKEYNVTLFATGWTPEGEPILEKIEQKISVPSPYALGILGLSPIDITVTDPDELIINKQTNEISGATYIEDDFNGDGDVDDVIVIPDRKIGDYLMTAVPEPDAVPTDTCTLEVSVDDLTIVLAKDVPVSDLPQQPYVIESTETGASQRTTFNAVWDSVNYPVVVSSNSTAANFIFNQSLNQTSFEISGEIGEVGYCNVTIPKVLLKGEPWTVKVNGADWSFTPFENATHSFLYFTYTHASTLQVAIQGTWVIPEFPSVIILSLFMIFSMIVTVFIKRKVLRKLEPYARNLVE